MTTNNSYGENGKPIYLKDLIIEETRKHPNRSQEKIAGDLGTTREYVAKIVHFAKKNGLLPKRRYGITGAKPVRYEKEEKIEE